MGYSADQTQRAHHDRSCVTTADLQFPSFNVDYPDQLRADEFLSEFKEFVQGRGKGKEQELPKSDHHAFAQRSHRWNPPRKADTFGFSGRQRPRAGKDRGGGFAQSRIGTIRSSLCWKTMRRMAQITWMRIARWRWSSANMLRDQAIVRLSIMTSIRRSV